MFLIKARNSLRSFACVFLVGTCWDKDFRMCLVLSSQKVDQMHEMNSEFYLPEEQVSTSCESLLFD